MYIKNRLQLKILSFIIPLVLATIVLIGVFVAVNNKSFILGKAQSYIDMVTLRDKEKVEGYFELRVNEIEALSALISGTSFRLTPELGLLYDNALMSQIKNNPSINNIWVLWNSGFVHDSLLSQGWVWRNYSLKGVEDIPIGTSDSFELRFENIIKSENNGASDPYVSNGKVVMMMGAPVKHASGVVGYVGIEVRLSEIADIFEQGDDVIYSSVIANNGLFIYDFNKKLIAKSFEHNYPEIVEDIDVEKKISLGEAFYYEEKIDGVDHYSNFEPFVIPGVSKEWSVKSTVPISFIASGHTRSVLASMAFALIIVALLIFVIVRVLGKILAPVNEVNKALETLSVGNIQGVEELGVSSGDELSQISESLNNVVSSLLKTEGFAIEIGSGNLDSEYNVISEYDQLGRALLEMRKSLQDSREDQEKRKLEEERNTWSNVGIANFSETLRKDTDDMKKLGFNLISNLIDYLNVNQGAMFVRAEVEDGEEEYFELATAIAYGRDKYMQKQIKVGDGLVGRSIYEQKTIYLTEIPESYMNITSGLGTSSPKCVLIVPCVLENEVYGVIEIASFNLMEQHEVEFVEKLASSIASTISSVRMNEKTTRLLSASQTQSEELAAQEEELRQNLEEMEATQEDLKRQMEENSEMRVNLEKQNALLDALLTSLPDFIYFKDEECKFLRISDSMLHIFNAEQVSDVIGKSDYDFQLPELAEKYYNEEQRIMQSGNGFVDRVVKETLKDGTEVWSSITKLPILTASGDCIGTFGISKNITDLKKLEVEANKQKSLLDALLKTLPDYVYFKDKDSKFLRISNSMLELFDADTVDEVIGKSDFDFQSKNEAQEFFDEEQDIIKTRKGFANKVISSVLLDGTEAWHSITKLPLIGADGKVMGTYGISKNITAFKAVELEAKKQNTLLDSLLDLLPDYIYFKDTESRFIRLSKSMLHIFNAKSVDEIIGKSDFDFQPAAAAQVYYEEEKEIMRSRKGIVDKLLKEKLVDGSIVWNTITKLPLVTPEGDCIGTFGISKNVTNIKELEEKVELQKADLANILNEIPAEIYLKDKDGTYVVANDARASRFGKSAEDLIGSTDAEFMSKKEARENQEVNERLIKTGETIVADEKGDKGQIIKFIKKPFEIKHLDSEGVVGLRIDVDAIKSI